MCLLCVAAQRNIRILSLLQSLASDSVTPAHPHTSAKTSPTPPPESALPQESSILKDSSKAPSRQSVKRETRFKLPPSVKSSAVPQDDRKRKPSTLNMLGMQPEFDPALLGSLVTVLTNFASEENDLLEESQSTYHSPPPSTSTCHSPPPSTSTYRSPPPSTVGTQSLIESEIIPDTLPSSHTTTLTQLDAVPTDIDLSANLSDAGKIMTFSKLISGSGGSSAIEHTVSPDPHTSGEGVKRVAVHMPTPLTTTPTTELADRVGLLDLHFPTQHNQSQPKEQSEADSHYTHSHAPLSDGVGVPGSQVAPSTVYRRSVFSTPNPHHLDSVDSGRSHKAWSTEVTLLYTLGMTDTVIYGHTSHIRRRALMGKATNNGKENVGYGLLQLSEFSNDESSSSKSTWARSTSMSLCVWGGV